MQIEATHKQLQQARDDTRQALLSSDTRESAWRRQVSFPCLPKSHGALLSSFQRLESATVLLLPLNAWMTGLRP